MDAATDLQSSDLAAVFQREPLLFDTFVKGAPCTIAEGLCTRRGLVNGTRAIMHSLAFPDDTCDEMMQQIHNAERGSHVFLPYPPLTVNVELPNADVTRFANQATLIDGQVVLPLQTCRFPEILKIKLSTGTDSKIKMYPSMAQLAFVITLDKSQGQTIDRLLVNINPSKSRRVASLTFQKLYVAISRVRRGECLRLFSPDAGSSFEFLKKLHSDPDLDVFLKCFDSGGKWNPPLQASRPTPASRRRNAASTSATQLIAARPTPPPRRAATAAQSNAIPRRLVPEHSTVQAALVPNAPVVPRVSHACPPRFTSTLRMSQVYVPLIYAVLDQHDACYSPHIPYIRNWYGIAEWDHLVARYQADFAIRSIHHSTAGLTGYIDADSQEKLLYPLSVAPGESEIEDDFYWGFQKRLSGLLVSSPSIF